MEKIEARKGQTGRYQLPDTPQDLPQIDVGKCARIFARALCAGRRRRVRKGGALRLARPKINKRKGRAENRKAPLYICNALQIFLGEQLPFKINMERFLCANCGEVYKFFSSPRSICLKFGPLPGISVSSKIV